MNISLEKDISKIRYLFYGFVLLMIFRFYYLNLLLHQLEEPVLNFPGSDNTYWFFLFLGIPQFLVSSFTSSLLFDISLIGVTILCLLYSKYRIFPFIFSVLFLMYFITINNFQAHHAHYLIGILLLSFLFLFNSKSFVYVFYFLRYYVLFVFVSSALWKICRGSVFQLDHMSNTLFGQHLYLLTDHPSSNYALFIKFLIDHPIWSQTVFIVGTLFQLAFGIGFFTRKYDKLLMISFICFFIGNFMVNQLPYFEFYIFLITLLSWKGIIKFYDRNINLLNQKRTQEI